MQSDNYIVVILFNLLVRLLMSSLVFFYWIHEMIGYWFINLLKGTMLYYCDFVLSPWSKINVCPSAFSMRKIIFFFSQRHHSLGKWRWKKKPSALDNEQLICIIDLFSWLYIVLVLVKENQRLADRNQPSNRSYLFEYHFSQSL